MSTPIETLSPKQTGRASAAADSSPFFTIELRQLPFTPDPPEQVIYTEKAYNTPLNDFIRRNYRKLSFLFRRKGLEFCYIPLLEKVINKNRYRDYYAPAAKGKKLRTTTPAGNDFILHYLATPQNKPRIRPCLLFYHRNALNPNRDAYSLYNGCFLRIEEALAQTDKRERDRALMQAFRTAANEIRDFIDRHTERVLFRTRDDNSQTLPTDADAHFDQETARLISEIRKRLDKLSLKGIGTALLRQMLDEPDELSRLVITKDHRILLPDYNIQIHLPPLPKAVYLLFLRHEEGILFKELSDYRAELTAIYLSVRPHRLHTDIKEKEKQSIEDLTDPFNNSINEKCARIRKEFLLNFDDRLARYYYIDGRRAEPKRIALPRELVIME